MALETVSIIGGESLLGRELQDVLSELSLPIEVQMLGSEEGTGILTEQGGEPVYIGALDATQLAQSRIALLAGKPEAAQRAVELGAQAKARPVLVDLSFGLEEHPQARLRAPQLEAAEGKVPREAIHVIAHPAALALALLYERLQQRSPVEQSVVQVFAPASEHGQKGMNELQKQTVSVLSLKPLDQEVFDAQSAFNLLPRLGSEAPYATEELEGRIERHLATLLALIGKVQPPSLRVVQAPVFHGYSLSLWVRFRENPGPDAVAAALAGPEFDVRYGEEEHPHNVGIAGQSGVTIGAIEQDRNDSRAVWLWAVADNLRLMADTAALVVKELL